MKIRLMIFLMLLALLLTGCNAQEAPPPEVTQSPAATPAAAEKSTGVGFYFDTVVTVTLYGAQEGLMDDIWALCHRYEQLLSRTVEDSDVSRINRAGGEPVSVDAETWQMLRRAKEISTLTGGAFSATIAPLSSQWDFTGGTNRMPTDAERLAALPLVDDTKILLNEDGTVTLPAGMAIDLGGIAKGYIADQAAALVKDRCMGATLNFGGNVYAVGRKPDGSDFGLGIQDPSDETGKVLAAIRGTDVSVVTSGIYERFFMMDGVRYHHILDPENGLPADTDLASATILSVSSMDADALATACIVMGLDEGKQLLEQLNLPGVLITRDGQVVLTDGFDQHYTFTLL